MKLIDWKIWLKVSAVHFVYKQDVTRKQQRAWYVTKSNAFSCIYSCDVSGSNFKKPYL